MGTRITRYGDFFDHYLREHSQPRCRALHYLGTSLSIIAIIMALISGQLSWIAVALVSGYGPAWIGHFFIEKNRPATFQYPFWSLISDYRMFGLWLTGRLPEALRRAGSVAAR
jgi:hypothetical protein